MGLLDKAVTVALRLENSLLGYSNCFELKGRPILVGAASQRGARVALFCLDLLDSSVLLADTVDARGD